MNSKIDQKKLDELYNRYNRQKYVHPDPLEFLYAYKDFADREISGLIASCLAYGRVDQILKSAARIFKEMEPSPSLFLKEATFESLRQTFSGFTHRFATGETLSMLLMGVKTAIEKYGSLYQCFLCGLDGHDETILPALTLFAQKIKAGGIYCPGHLLPCPQKGSPCKRLNLFLRWMVRQDDVDPGGWSEVPRSKLIVPLDTHMHRIAIRLGLTSRNQADMRTALEITAGFRKILPDDPVKYDFALTRLGIRKDADPETFLDGLKSYRSN
jgi:uncharacterized protein (TIGR02757 family)